MSKGISHLVAAMTIEIGAELSNLIAGVVVAKAGYNAGFLMLAAISIVAVAIFWFKVTETKPGSSSQPTPV